MLMPHKETADSEQILRELRGCRQENKEQVEDIEGKIVKLNTKLRVAIHDLLCGKVIQRKSSFNRQNNSSN